MCPREEGRWWLRRNVARERGGDHKEPTFLGRYVSLGSKKMTSVLRLM